MAPVTEFVSLKLKDPHAVGDSDLRNHLHTLSFWQSQWSGYALTFYTDTHDRSVIYLVSGWRDVDAHNEWIKSDQNQQLLRVFEPFLDIAEYGHLRLDFASIPTKTEALAFIKETTIPASDDNGDPEPNTNPPSPSVLWRGSAEGVERPQEHYHLIAYSGDHTNQHPPGGWKYATKIDVTSDCEYGWKFTTCVPSNWVLDEFSLDI